MRSIALATSCVLGLVAFEATAAAQTSVEYGAAAARAATAVGSASKGAGGLFNSLDKALKSATDPRAGASAPAKPPAVEPKTAAKTTTAPAQPEKVAPPPAPTYEDPAGIKAGLAYDELLTRFGPPSLEIITGPGASSLDYITKEGGVRVECRDGKVVAAGKT
jgi:hypothetical protein